MIDSIATLGNLVAHIPWLTALMKGSSRGLLQFTSGGVILSLTGVRSMVEIYVTNTYAVGMCKSLNLVWI